MNRPTPTAHFYESQRLRLHYLDWGNPTAPPLILVHGGRDHCRNWDSVAAELRTDFHVITPDLRGHGDSEWASDGQYPVSGFVYDLALLIEQLGPAPVRLIGHSLGGSICLRYAGIYPERVSKLVAIEGLGFIPGRTPVPIGERMRKWIEQQHALVRRPLRRFATIAAAEARMLEANPHLSAEQAQHLTFHGIRENGDGSWSWKFDPYLRSFPPAEADGMDLPELWSNIRCPVLLAYGTESWASNPAEDGRLANFQEARVAVFEGAGHWLHHDRLGTFLSEVKDFLAESEQPPSQES